MILSIIFGFMIWFGWSLYGSWRSKLFEWKQIPKTPIAIVTAIISYLSTPNVLSYMEIVGTINYLPFSYPFLLSYRGFAFPETGELFIGLILSEFGFSLKDTSVFPFSISLIISITFFLVNYAVTMLSLNYLSKRLVKNVSTNELREVMKSNNQKSALVGCCIIYCCLAVIVFIGIVFALIKTAIESQVELMFFRDIINYFGGPLIFLSLIIAPLIGSTIIVHRTKELSIGIRSIKYFFIPILYLNVDIVLDSLFEVFFLPDPYMGYRFLQAFAAGMFIFLLIAVLLSRFISLKLLSMLVRTNYLSTVEKL